MTRDEAIEAGARALRRQQTSGLCHLGRTCDLCDCFAPREEDDRARRHAAAVLDAVGWAEPAGWVAGVRDQVRDGRPVMVEQYVCDTAEDALDMGGGVAYALTPVDATGWAPPEPVEVDG